MIRKWTFYTALRYFRNRRKGRKITISRISTIGIGIGVMAIISVLGVMNGFQIGFIEAILNITSFHVRVEPDIGAAETGLGAASGMIDEVLYGRIRGLPGVESVLPLKETQGMASGVFSSPLAVALMGVPAEAGALDPLFLSHLSIVSGSFDLSGSHSIVMGAQLAFSLGVECGDHVEVSSLSGEQGKPLAVSTESFLVRGIFESGYYQYDSTLAIVPLDGLAAFRSPEIPLVYGIKLANRYHDLRALRELSGIVPAEKGSVVSWREYNRSFFSALRLEKLLLMVLLGLIFIVVGFNIRSFLRREVLKRREEIGILKAMGAEPRSIQWLFIMEGFLIGLAGVICGAIVGILISTNINALFGFAEDVVNWCGALIAMIGSGISGSAEDFTLFSPAYFYIKEVPSILIPKEVIGTCLFALAISTLAGLEASRGVSRITASAVLRGEELE